MLSTKNIKNIINLRFISKLSYNQIHNKLGFSKTTVIFYVKKFLSVVSEQDLKLQDSSVDFPNSWNKYISIIESSVDIRPKYVLSSGIKEGIFNIAQQVGSSNFTEIYEYFCEKSFVICINQGTAHNEENKVLCQNPSINFTPYGINHRKNFFIENRFFCKRVINKGDKYVFDPCKYCDEICVDKENLKVDCHKSNDLINTYNRCIKNLTYIYQGNNIFEEINCKFRNIDSQFLIQKKITYQTIIEVLNEYKQKK